MALVWDMTEIDGLDLSDGSEWRDGHGQWSESLIWYVLFTDLGWQVTEENIEEFVARIRTLEGWDLGVTTEAVPEEAIRAHVGLRVNVSPVDRGKWLARKFEQAFPKAEKQSKEEVEW